ncbi:MAG: hypothetical protein JWQ23_1184 [Herminiimonas sp.]|nr:hypothetical protein [Herminiimonas sp.]
MRLYRLLWIFISLSVTFQATAQTSPMSPQGTENIDEATIERIEIFLQRFIDPDKTVAEQAALFTENVEYYDRGMVGKAEILKDINYSVRRWPWRFYRLASIDYITRDPASVADRIFVTYTLSFEVANPSKTIAGTASYAALIVDLNTEPKIQAITEKVRKRNRLQTLDD